jgi:hypothetical protein
LRRRAAVFGALARALLRQATANAGVARQPLHGGRPHRSQRMATFIAAMHPFASIVGGWNSRSTFARDHVAPRWVLHAERVPMDLLHRCVVDPDPEAVAADVGVVVPTVQCAACVHEDGGWRIEDGGLRMEAGG